MVPSHYREYLESVIQVVNSMSVLCSVHPLSFLKKKRKKEGKKKKPEKVFIINEINTNHKTRKNKANYIYLIPYGLHPVFWLDNRSFGGNDLILQFNPTNDAGRLRGGQHQARQRAA